ncbi:MAG: methyltransferase domain-containing protein [Candidatus Omnitrophica bacterium]|nr:methyltransferase domain-containing protein [Candidatus Omnitrophota bacterium]
MCSGSDAKWKDPKFARQYLERIVSGVPLEALQFEIVFRLIDRFQGHPSLFLDLGCGGGIVAERILKRYPDANGVLADFSEEMLQEARRKLVAWRKQVSFSQVDYSRKGWIFALPVRQYSLVLSRFSIHHQPDARKKELYEECFDSLEPGGLFFNIEHVSSPTAHTRAVWEQYMIDHLYRYQQQRGTGKKRKEVEQDYIRRAESDRNVLAPVEKQCEWLRQIGFDDVDCYFKVFELAIFGGRKPSVSS